MNTKAKKAASGVSGTEKGNDRRQRILNAARHRFATSGFESTTVRQIADDVGLLAGSLYYHFANKEEMLHEALRDIVYRLRDGAQELHTRDGDPESKLVALIFFDVEERTANQEAHSILHQERAYFRQNPDLEYISKARREHYLVWRALIEQGIAEGYFSSDINVFLTLTTMIRMLNTGADWFLHDDPATIDAAGIISREELSAFYVKLVLRSVRTPDRITAPIPWPARYAVPGSG
jgi:AcrR family transcriptional regulator